MRTRWCAVQNQEITLSALWNVFLEVLSTVDFRRIFRNKHFSTHIDSDGFLALVSQNSEKFLKSFIHRYLSFSWVIYKKGKNLDRRRMVRPLFLVPQKSSASSTFFRVVEVWKSMKTWRYCRYEPFLILYLVPLFSCLQKCGEVWQSRDKVAIIPVLRTPCNSLVRSTLLRALKVPWNIVWPT